MTLTELAQLLKATGFSVAYSHFKVTENNPAPDPPFITYLEFDSDNFHADNKTYKQVKNVNVELYTVKKDLAAEKKIEDIFDANDIPYESDETYIKDQDLFQKIYQIGVI
ncbi:hypothetical protein [Metabacillus halosaccharovorans]|uniref:hypothetical protein n=1 Tax=Metabacillus halosaccharovorans TaxID=930124 RepID=UPI00099585CF|nr:hypothetical protein [Metabacillus halosaccharovorans]